MAKRRTPDIDNRSVAPTEQISIAALNDLEDITHWLGTFRVRLAASRDAERSGVAVTVDQLEARYKQRRAELA
jgi:hypothetical protein